MSLAEQFAKDAGEAASQASLSSMFQQDVSAPAAQSPAQPSDTSPSKLKGSAAGGVFMGLRDAVDAGAQLLRRAVPDSVGNAIDALGNKLHDYGLPVAASNGVGGVDQIVNNANQEYDQSKQLDGRSGVDLARVAGNIANPINRVIPMAGAGGALGIGVRAGAQGAISGLATPVVGSDAQDSFAGNKLLQTGLGGASGAVGGVFADKVSSGIGSGANKLISAVRASMPNAQANAQANATVIINQAAQDAGIDLSQVPQSILGSVRSQVADALASGKTLDAAAAIRKAEGDAVLGDAGLTLGQATRDPGQFTQEMNLRGVQGAGAPLMQRFSDQNNALINAMNKQGASAAPGAYQAGDSVIGSLAARDASKQADVSGLYKTAEQIGGGNVPLDVESFVKTARQNLTDQMRDLHLPSTVSKRLDMFESGQTPLTVGTGEQFKSILAQDIANAQARGQGNEVHALNIVRDALNDTGPLLGGEADQGAAAMQAFNAARAAARDRFGEIDGNPALKAVVNGQAAPDNFFQKYVINGKAQDVDALLGLAPDQGGALRNQVVAYLKDKALGGASDEVGKFSQSGYNKALGQLGDAKLNALFSPEDVARLKQIGRVASYVQSQPAGAAVNNSNTAAAVMNLFSQIASGTGKLPGANLVRNSIKQYKDEKAVTNALEANIRPNASPVVTNPLRPLLPYLPGAFGTLGAQLGQ
ncbi:hypothetical protein [Caballeronia sp. NCTM1]|uniref:hypothetical protein n=1 Tax=Caballeronia sp. NCTM1 TaxID=2921753 RepID=UPI00202873E3|nr:hypothetical protein [Caballeronia sp. NCTM1]